MNPKKAERNRKIVELRNRSPRMTYEQIGTLMKISRQRAHQIYVQETALSNSKHGTKIARR